MSPCLIFPPNYAPLRFPAQECKGRKREEKKMGSRTFFPSQHDPFSLPSSHVIISGGVPLLLACLASLLGACAAAAACLAFVTPPTLLLLLHVVVCAIPSFAFSPLPSPNQWPVLTASGVLAAWPRETFDQSDCDQSIVI